MGRRVREHYQATLPTRHVTQKTPTAAQQPLGYVLNRGRYAPSAGAFLRAPRADMEAPALTHETAQTRNATGTDDSPVVP